MRHRDAGHAPRGALQGLLHLGFGAAVQVGGGLPGRSAMGNPWEILRKSMKFFGIDLEMWSIFRIYLSVRVATGKPLVIKVAQGIPKVSQGDPSDW